MEASGDSSNQASARNREGHTCRLSRVGEAEEGLSFYICCVCVYVCVGMHVPLCTCGGQKTAGRNWSSASTV